MSRRVRHLAVMLLLLVLPLQALAAAMMTGASTAHHSVIAALSGHGDAVKSHSGTGHHHSGLAGLLPHQHGNGGHESVACSGCADCCCPISLVAANTVNVPAFDGGEAAVPFVPPAVPDLLPHRLERPPRNLLA